MGITTTTHEFIRVKSKRRVSPSPAPAELARKIIPGREYWKTRETSVALEYTEVLGVVAMVTALGWFLPVSYHAFGHIYLLAVIMLSLRVGRWPAPWSRRS